MTELELGLERMRSGFRFTEGPVWVPSGHLLFSDIPGDTIYRLGAPEQTEVFRRPSGNANGLTLDREGRLIACEHGNRRVSRTGSNGEISVVADRYRGRRLNSPNDVVVSSDGAVYFTDPPYGIRPDEQEQPVRGVYRVPPGGGEPELIVDDFEAPNGLVFSPDELVLYVSDSERRHLRAFEVQADGLLSGGRLFHDMPGVGPEKPDGMVVDEAGHIFCTGPGGVWVFNPQGDHVGTIGTPERAANCAWGDADMRSLYITATTSVYRLRPAGEGSLFQEISTSKPALQREAEGGASR